MARLTHFIDGNAYPDKSQHQNEPVDTVNLSLTRELPYQSEYVVLILPGNGSYKERLEGIVEVLTELGHGISLTKREFDKPITTNGMNIQFAEMFRALAYFTGYLINSTSWRDQEVKAFDLAEFDSRLEKVRSILMQNIKP